MIGEGQEIIKQFLQEIQFNIESIDGGCSSCVSEFCEGVNESLIKYGLKIELSGEDDAFTCGIKIIEI